MRAAGDHLSIGERVAYYRVRRGLTQAVLAGLVGRTEDWLSKVERGERQVNRLDVLTELARALRVNLGDLLGQPVLAEDDEQNDDIPAIRDALMSPRRLSRVLFRDAPTPNNVDRRRAATLVEFSWSDYQSGHIGRVFAALPGLIGTAQHLESLASTLDGVAASECWAISARTHHLAATSLIKVGESDLSWMAAEKSMQAADKSDDPLVLASAARSGTHALLSVGRYSDALELGTTASNWLSSLMNDDDPAALSLYGMLNLRTAAAAALHQDRSTSTDLLRLAGTAAMRLGRDANYWQTGFGPTNVELHRISAALYLGDFQFVAERGPMVHAEQALPERRVSLRIDVARALGLLVRDDAAVEVLLSAEAEAPQLVRHNPMVRETVRALYRRASTVGRASENLRGLAERCRAIT